VPVLSPSLLDGQESNFRDRAATVRDSLLNQIGQVMKSGPSDDSFFQVETGGGGTSMSMSMSMDPQGQNRVVNVVVKLENGYRDMVAVMASLPSIVRLTV
jgi:hypothetical protein